MNVCLPPQAVDTFKKALVSGAIDPGKLSKMTSAERRTFFEGIVGKGDAKTVNSLFESKLLLKNQQQGMLTWAKSVAGLKPEVQRDLISRVKKLDRILDPVEEKAFLSDLASTKLGFDVSAVEAKQIANMSRVVREAEAKRGIDKRFPTEVDRIAYGRAKVELGSYLANLKLESEKMSIKDQILKQPVSTVGKTAGIAKSLKASLDNSAIFRQGWKTLWTNPGAWQKNARQSFIDIARQLGNKEVLKEISADIVSRPNYDKYTKMKLAVGNIEEEFPSTLPEKIPVFGRAFKASEAAYTGFLYRQRADIADKLLEVAEKSGVNTSDAKELQAIGLLINSLTGRGNLGRLEGTSADTLNNLFFSARFFKSNLDVLTMHTGVLGIGRDKGMTPFARKQAATNLLKIASGTAMVLAIADMTLPGSVEWDPRSSDFGKIKVNNTRFDVTGGMGSIVVLASQLIKQETKSTTTGVLKKMGQNYGDKNGMDYIFNFFANKFSPAAAVVRDLIRQSDFAGNAPTPQGIATSLLVPIPITTNWEAHKDPTSAPQLVVFVADALGIGANVYGATERSTAKLSKTQEDFKAKIGTDKFEQANKEYELGYDAWLLTNKKKLETLPQEDRQGHIGAAKKLIQKRIYEKYDFKPTKTTKSESDQNTRKSLLESIK